MKQKYDNNAGRGADRDKLQKCEYTVSVLLPELVETACYENPENKYYLVECEPKDHEGQMCPICKIPTKYHVHDWHTVREVRDITIGSYRVELDVRIPRYMCHGCENAFTRRLDSIMGNPHLTTRLYKQIQEESFLLPPQFVADRYGCSVATIEAYFDQYVDELIALRGETEAPEVLGLFQRRVVKHDRPVFVDVESDEILGICSDSKKDKLRRTIEAMANHDRNIQYVVIDMLEEYREVVQKAIPHAKIVVDKRSVMEIVDTYVLKKGKTILSQLKKENDRQPDASRKKEIAELLAAASKDHYLFTNVSDNPKRKELLDTLSQASPEFQHWYWVRSCFSNIYSSTSAGGAANIFKEWRQLVPPATKDKWPEWESEYQVSAEMFADLIPLAEKLEDWKEAICEYCGKYSLLFDFASTQLDKTIGRVTLSETETSFVRARKRALLFQTAKSQMGGYILEARKRPKYAHASAAGGTQFLNFAHDNIVGYETVYRAKKVLGSQFLEYIYQSFYREEQE